MLNLGWYEGLYEMNCCRYYFGEFMNGMSCMNFLVSDFELPYEHECSFDNFMC